MRLLLVALSLSLTLAGGTKKFTMEDALGVQAVANPKFSPDGKWIVYSVSAWNKEKNRMEPHLYLVAADGGDAMRLTNGEKGESGHEWSPAGGRIAFLADRDTEGTKGNQIWLIRQAGGEAEKLTSEESAVTAFTWSPDGKRVAYVTKDVPKDKTEREKRKKDKFDAVLVEEDFQYAHLWTIDVESKKKARVTEGAFSVRTPKWSPDGKWIAYAGAVAGTTETPYGDISRDSLTDIFVVAPEGGAVKRLTENPGADASPEWSADSGRIAYLTRTDAKSWVAPFAVAVVPVEGGTPRVLTAGMAESAADLAWAGTELYFTSPRGVYSHVFSVPAAGGAVRAVTSGEKSYAQFDVSGKKLAYVVTGKGAAAEIHTSDGRLTRTNPQLEEMAVADAEILLWKGPDGYEIEGVMTRPLGYEAGRKYPLVLQIHGGPYSRFDAAFSARVQILAAKGYAVLQPNPRGSLGYGNAFAVANVGDWGGKDFADIMAGVDAAIAKGVADPDKLVVMGGSYGGFMTFWTITQTNRFKAAIGHAGISDWYSFHGQSDIPGLMEFGLRGYPWTAETYRKFSPMTYVDRVKTPILITHGENDRRVAIAQAEEYYRALKSRGVPVRFVRYPREGHGITEPNHQLDLNQRQLEWIDRHVGNQQ
ncbi:MAG: S9 family peptidase [Bryobacteraceae bacterium]